MSNCAPKIADHICRLTQPSHLISSPALRSVDSASKPPQPLLARHPPHPTRPHTRTPAMETPHVTAGTGTTPTPAPQHPTRSQAVRTVRRPLDPATTRRDGAGVERFAWRCAGRRGRRDGVRVRHSYLRGVVVGLFWALSWLLILLLVVLVLLC
jgi:hypothetical protein